jgi:hypothetical protein
MQQIENSTSIIHLAIVHYRMDQSICDLTQGLLIPAVEKVLELRFSISH